MQARPCTNISICRLHVVVNMQQNYHFCFKFELHKAHPCYFVLYQQRAEKGLLVLYIHFYRTHLFMLQTLTIRNKMTAPMAVLL